MYVGLHIKYPFFYQILMKLEFSRDIFEKCSTIKFHENPSSWSRVVQCGRTDRRTGGWTDRHDEVDTRLSLFCEGP